MIYTVITFIYNGLTTITTTAINRTYIVIHEYYSAQNKIRNPDCIFLCKRKKTTDTYMSFHTHHWEITQFPDLY